MLPNQFDEVRIGSKAGANRPRVARTDGERNQARRAGALVAQRKGTPLNRGVSDHQRIAKLDRENEVAPPSKIDPAVGNAIRDARQHKEMSQKDLAQKLSVSIRVIQDHETGNTPPDQKVLRDLQKLLGVKLTGKDIGKPLHTGRDKDKDEKTDKKKVAPSETGKDLKAEREGNDAKGGKESGKKKHAAKGKVAESQDSAEKEEKEKVEDPAKDEKAAKVEDLAKAENSAKSNGAEEENAA